MYLHQNMCIENMSIRGNIYRYIILIVLIIIFIFLLLFGIFGGWSNSELKLGIKAGESFLSKSLFFRSSFTRFISTIQVIEFDSIPGKEVVIFSMKECYILDIETRRIKKKIEFNKTIDLRPELLPIKDDGSLEIIKRGGGFGDVGLVNEKGEFIWKYKQVGTSPEMASGDLDRDGKLEFYVTDFDGLRKLDYSGKKIWRTGDHLWELDIQIYDPARDKTPLIVTSGVDEKIRFWDNEGKLVREITPERKIYNLEIIKWIEGYNILTNDGGNCILVMNFDGKTVYQYCYKKEWHTKIPILRSSYEIFEIRGAPVKLDVNKKAYLAVITDFRSYVSKTMLNIFSPEGQLVYQELLNSTRGMATVENADGSESLLLGDGAENVWFYELKK